jgi:hypothetical protein
MTTQHWKILTALTIAVLLNVISNGVASVDCVTSNIFPKKTHQLFPATRWRGYYVILCCRRAVLSAKIRWAFLLELHPSWRNGLLALPVLRCWLRHPT